MSRIARVTCLGVTRRGDSFYTRLIAKSKYVPSSLETLRPVSRILLAVNVDKSDNKHQLTLSCGHCVNVDIIV